MSSSSGLCEKKRKEKTKKKRLGGQGKRKGYPTPLTSFLNIKKEEHLNLF